MNKLKLFFLDLLLSPLTLIGAFWFKYIRKTTINLWRNKFPISYKIFDKVGVFPIIDHFYEPLIDTKKLRYSLKNERALKGIDWNISEQLSVLSRFHFNNEILQISKEPVSQLTFSFTAGSFGSGDAEYLYNIIRTFKPKRIIEIGCGQSTLMMQQAIARNKSEDGSCLCNHICIEPYLNDWLEKLPVKVIRDLVEHCHSGTFTELQENDILFIDSSHIIRPQGDVLFEYLEILPILNRGVIVHIHDIFTPRDYLDEWILGVKTFWNEQYLFEAFLCFNNSYKVLGALNFLKHNYYSELSAKCPILDQQREPGSFWIQKKA